MIDALQERLSVGHNYFVANYPPFQAWSAQALPAVEGAFQTGPRPGTPLGVYVHIPFCRKRCRFCYYKVYTERSASEVSRYVSAIHRELEIQSRTPAIAGRRADFVYFGGGTPSYLSGDELRRLAEGMRAVLPWSEEAEITCLVRQPGQDLAILLAVQTQEVLSEQRHVVLAVAQRR